MLQLCGCNQFLLVNLLFIKIDFEKFHLQDGVTVPLTRNLPPLVSRETRRVSFLTRRVSRETRITEPWGVEYITREKPVYIGKLMTPPVLKSAID